MRETLLALHLVGVVLWMGGLLTFSRVLGYHAREAPSVRPRYTWLEGRLNYLVTIPGMVIVSIGVCIGMWLERFLIVVPSLGHKYLPYSWSYYLPRPTEILITIATFAAMMLLYTLTSKFVPIISIWEMNAANHQPPADGHAAHAAPAGEPRLEGHHA